MTYTVILTDGTALKNLTLNGNNFISTTPIDYSIFDNNCSPVIISDGENSEMHSHMELIIPANPTGKDYWFVLRDLSQQEIKEMKTRSDIEYLSMMMGIEL